MLHTLQAVLLKWRGVSVVALHDSRSVDVLVLTYSIIG
jgi:hypothetical protein